ncbi:SixA phosphatase family protein [Rhodobaculum claviforme]|uniref:Phosphoglycerate mutase n=1 Tax=Rhodobaculum claviforme TaxID=1549854 RepID=A0A934TMJ4_9RHOB|nr:histidine phosphatase family protein [Rhodobaculum claviforme]MBK5928226.1 phosphoglycerate mutase [Rhodobaculum claviforme]
MAVRLILVRHAKSDWGDGDLEDHARPLNARGRDAAGRVGRWLAATGRAPHEALVSSAVRTRETWARMAPHLPDAPEARVIDALYHAGPDVMLRVLQGARAPVVVLLGHNPGIAAFAHWMLSAAPTHGRFGDYPTGATLVARFPADRWADVAPASGVAEAFVVPRELPEG